MDMKHIMYIVLRALNETWNFRIIGIFNSKILKYGKVLVKGVKFKERLNRLQ